MRVLALMAISICISSKSKSQDFNIPFRKGNLWGYAALDGRIKITPAYDSVQYRQDNNRWLVYRGGKMGIVDEKGAIILDPVYDTISWAPVHSRYNDFYIVKNGKEGFADMNGKIIITPLFEAVTRCEGNNLEIGRKFLLKENGNWRLADPAMKTYLSNIQSFRSAYNGNYLVKVNGLWGVFNTVSNEQLLPFEYDSIMRLQYLDFYELKNEYRDYRYYATKGNKTYLLTKAFSPLILENKTIADLFVEQVKSDAMVTSPVQDMFELNNGQQYMTFNLEDGYKNGETVHLKYYYFSNGLRGIRVIKQDGKMGLDFNYRNETAKIPPVYDELRLIRYSEETVNTHFVLVRKNKKWGLHSNLTHSLVVPLEYDEPSIIPFRYERLLLFTAKKKKAAFNFNYNSMNDITPAMMQPFNGKIKQSVVVSSLGDSYTRFLTIFYLEEKGKLYPIGSNGVKYWED